jgi:ribosomal 50S subunit-recycling heat shock protein
MKRLILVVVAVLFCASVVFAAGPKTYQVTGPVLEIKDGMIIVEKGKDKWEIAKDAATKVTGELKVGSKVMIEYTMKAATIEVKEAKKAEKKEKEEKKKDEKKKEEPKKK